MIGIVKSSLPGGREMSAMDALQAAATLGVEGLLFATLFDISPPLDRTEMHAVRTEADRLGLTLSSSLGFINPAAPARGAKLIELGQGDMAEGAKHLINLAADIGILDLFFVIGMIEDRFETSPSWQQQCEAVADLLCTCGPVLRARGAKLLLKTHEEMFTAEVMALVESVGSDILGVAFDPVNVVCRLEDPLAAARRVAPHAVSVHVDDAVLRFEDDGFRRYLAPMGEGQLDWPAMLALMPGAKIWLEMHAGQFAMPVFDAAWLRSQPQIALPEFAAVLALAQRFGNRPMPWDQARPTDRLPQALRHILQ